MWRRSVPRLVAAASTSAAVLRPRGSSAPELARHLSVLPARKEALSTRRDVLYDRIKRKLETTQPLSIEKLDRTIEFLEGFGLTKDRALEAVSRHPMMTHYTTAMMEEKICGLLELGMTKSMLTVTLGRHPNIIGVRTKTVKALRDWYISLGVSSSKIPFMLAVFPQATSMSICDNLNPKVEVLRGAGLSSERLVRILQRTPQILTLSIERIQSQVKFLRQLGLSQEEVSKLISIVPEALSLSTANIDAKMKLLDELFGRSAGVTALCVNARILMRNPGTLRRSFHFLTQEVGIDPARLAANTTLIMRTVDAILQPRYEFLVETETNFDFSQVWWIIASNEQFADKFPEYTAFLAIHGKRSA